MKEPVLVSFSTHVVSEVWGGLELPIVASGYLISKEFDKRTAEKHAL